MESQFIKFELVGLMVLLKDPLNFVDCLHFMVAVILKHFITKVNSVISFELQVLRTI